MNFLLISSSGFEEEAEYTFSFELPQNKIMWKLSFILNYIYCMMASFPPIHNFCRWLSDQQ